MTDVFISYSRKDIAVARLLNESLARSNMDTWIDEERIPTGERWWQVITQAIESSAVVMFLISRHSVGSDVCHQELTVALQNHKRVIPILVDETDMKAIGQWMPELAEINWISFRRGREFELRDNGSGSGPLEERVEAAPINPRFEAALLKLHAAIKTDWTWVREHMRLQVAALRWQRNGCDPSTLLRGRELINAESWLLQQGIDPQPSQLQIDYVTASRRVFNQARLRTRVAAAVSLTLIAGLTTATWLLRGQSETSGQRALEAEATAAVEFRARATEEAGRLAAQATAAGEAQRADVEAIARVTEEASRLAAQSTAVAQAQRAEVEARARTTEEAGRLVAQATAEAEAARARTEASNAERQARRVKAAELADEVDKALAAEPPDLSLALLLAREAILATLYDDQNVTPVAARAAFDALEAAPPWRQTLPPHTHSGPILSAVFSPDGRQVLTASRDGTARIWDAFSGEQLLLLHENEGDLLGAAYSHDGSLIVTYGASPEPGGLPQAIVWDAHSGDRLRWLRHETGVITSAQFSPDDTRVLTAGSDGFAQLWDAGSGAELLRLRPPTGNALSATFSPDGMRILAVDEYSIFLWDASSGELVLEISATDHHRVSPAAFSPDGSTIVLGGPNGTVEVWEVKTGRLVLQLASATDSLGPAQFSPDGTRILTLDDDFRARLWDATSGALVAELAGHTAPIRSAEVSADNTRIVTAGGDGTVLVWDAASGEQLHLLKGHTAPVQSVRFSPNGAQIVSASWDGTARLWDARTGMALARLGGHTDAIKSVACSPDGSHIATGAADGEALIWDSRSGAVQQQLSGHEGAVWSVDYSPDGLRIATGGQDGTVRVWGAQDGRALMVSDPYVANAWSVDFSPDGTRLLAVGCDRLDRGGLCVESSVRVWDATGARELLRPSGGRGVLIRARYSPDGARIFGAGCAESGSDGGCSEGEVLLWDAQTGQELLRIPGLAGSALAADFSPDGRRIAVADDNQVRVWDANDGRELLRLGSATEWYWWVAYSPNGKRIATTGCTRPSEGGAGCAEWGAARVWDAESGEALFELAGHEGRVNKAAYSPDGESVVTVSDDHTARVWEIGRPSTLLRLSGHTGQVWSAAYNPAGDRIVTASADGTARVWDVESGQELMALDGHRPRALMAAHSPDGRYIAAARADGRVEVWDADTGVQVSMSNVTPMLSWPVVAFAYSPDDAQMAVLGCLDEDCSLGSIATRTADARSLLREFRNIGSPESLAYSPDGRKIAVGGNTVFVMDVDSGEQLLELDGHSGPVRSVAFSPDGRRVLTAGFDGVAIVWDAESGQEILKLAGHTGEARAVFNPDQSQIATAGADGTIRIWDARAGSLLEPLMLESGSAINWLAYSPDGRQLAVARDQVVTVLETRSFSTLFELVGHASRVNSVAYSPDGARIVTASDDRSVLVWDANDGRKVAELAPRSTTVASAIYSPDGATILTSGADETARIWDAGSGRELLQLAGHTGLVDSAAFSPDGAQVVTAADDGTIRVWETRSGAELPWPQTDPGIFSLSSTCRGISTLSYSAGGTPICDGLYGARFDPAGARIISGEDGVARIWDAQSGLLLLQLPQHIPGFMEGRVDIPMDEPPVLSAVYSPDGRLIVTASADQLALVRDAATGNVHFQLLGHTSYIEAAAFSPDSRLIATASADRTARIWSARTGAELLQLSGHEDSVNSVAFSPNGKYVVTSSSDQTARVWPASPYDLPALLVSLVQRDPPVLTPEERAKYGLPPSEPVG